MPAKVFQLHPERQPIGQYIRVGRSHRQLEALLASGQLPIERAVFDASALARQKDLLRALGETQRELVLDTNVAELSAIGRFQGNARQAPWAIDDRPLDAHDVERPEFTRAIAKVAVENGFSAVLAPTHFLTSASDKWLRSDLAAAVLLRRALDAEGGRSIALDYVLSIPNQVLRDSEQRQLLVNALRDLPFENLWLRISQFGVDATGLGVRRYIESLQDFLALGRPIIADGVAGLAALATVAFGAAGGVAHGVGDMERFDASNWNKAPKEGGFGLPTRVLVTALDRQLSQEQVAAIVAAPGGRKLISCSASCCRRGLDDTWNNPKAHYLSERRRQILELAAVPDLRRTYHFLNHEVAVAERKARSLARLKVANLTTKNMLSKESSRLGRLLQVMEHLQSSGGSAQRSTSPPFRAASVPPGRRAQI